ncbi:AAA family ATPase [Porphyrobacter algicida]|uniref:AAA family ATPase n=1 Tax=Qipengyuania algicida TaxID=1836209 RepID=A0A845AJ64_9SPHN|nr:AAA family ATPase [Qipengyuania algicida]MXP28951.1 AAA family ATPase [Qipengyuania algicida]
MYEQFYGLSCRPFEANIDAVEYFPGLTFRKAITTIGHGLNKGGGVVLVTGSKGAGKSSLLLHLRDKLEAEAVTLAMLSVAELGAQGMLEGVLQGFALDDPETHSESPFAALDLFCQDEARRGSRVLVLADDAQAAGEDGLLALQELGRLRLGDRPLVQMVLTGGLDFAETIAEIEGLGELRERLTVEYTLDGLMVDEIEPYVDGRLKWAGWEGGPVLAPSIAGQLHEATAGNPEAINRIMTRLLEHGADREMEILNSDLLEVVLHEFSDVTPDGEMLAATEGAVEDEMDRDVDKGVPGEVVADNEERQGDVAEVSSSPAENGVGSGLAEAQLVAIEEAFVQRDKTFSKLRREFDELREQAPAQEVASRIDRLEQRLEDQEQVLRHLLKRMIEVFETREQPEEKA